MSSQPKREREDPVEEPPAKKRKGHKARWSRNAAERPVLGLRRTGDMECKPAEIRSNLMPRCSERVEYDTEWVLFRPKDYTVLVKHEELGGCAHTMLVHALGGLPILDVFTEMPSVNTTMNQITSTIRDLFKLQLVQYKGRRESVVPAGTSHFGWILNKTSGVYLMVGKTKAGNYHFFSYNAWVGLLYIGIDDNGRHVWDDIAVTQNPVGIGQALEAFRAHGMRTVSKVWVLLERK